MSPRGNANFVKKATCTILLTSLWLQWIAKGVARVWPHQIRMSGHEADGKTIADRLTSSCTRVSVRKN